MTAAGSSARQLPDESDVEDVADDLAKEMMGDYMTGESCMFSHSILFSIPLNLMHSFPSAFDCTM